MMLWTVDRSDPRQLPQLSLTLAGPPRIRFSKQPKENRKPQDSYPIVGHRLPPGGGPKRDPALAAPRPIPTVKILTPVRSNGSHLLPCSSAPCSILLSIKSSKQKATTATKLSCRAPNQTFRSQIPHRSSDQAALGFPRDAEEQGEGRQEP